MIPMCYVVTDEGIPRGVFHEYHEACRFLDRHGCKHWRIIRTPYYG